MKHKTCNINHESWIMKHKAFKNRFHASGFKLREKGFTLVEVLVYVAVVGVLVTAVANLILGMVSNYRVASIRDELVLSAQDIAGSFFKEVKNANQIYVPGSVLDNDSGTLILETTFQLGDEYASGGQTKFYLSEGRILIKREGETALVLTPETLEVARFKFVRVEPKPGREGVRLYLALKNKTRPSETFSLTSFTMLRGRYLE